MSRAGKLPLSNTGQACVSSLVMNFTAVSSVRQPDLRRSLTASAHSLKLISFAASVCVFTRLALRCSIGSNPS